VIEVSPETRWTKRYCRVQIRRGDGWNVKPGADRIDGKCFWFTPGWHMTDEDTSIYVGEWAMSFSDPIAVSTEHPDAPGWIASGDLVEIAPMRSAK